MNELKYFHALKYSSTESRIPVALIHTLMLVSAFFIQSFFGLNWNQIVLTVVIFAIYITLYWFSEKLLTRIYTLYFILQGFLIILVSFVMSEVAPLTVLGMLPILLVQGMFYYREPIKLIALSISSILFYLAIMQWHFGWHNLLYFFIAYIILSLFVISILRLFNEKDAENDELQYYIEQLKVANQKIEQLTLANERQRMARDLHDTLAQRLVGLILKLEASEIHLKKGNIEKVEEILLSAQGQAKQSLQDARVVIDNVRQAQKMASFNEKIIDEVTQLQYTFKVPIEVKIEEVELSANEEAQLLSIMKEAITNSCKHASPTKITVKLQKDKKAIVLAVQDNGLGIELSKDLNKRGHYGILGMNERASLMGASFNILNENGTCIIVTLTRGEE